MLVSMLQMEYICNVFVALRIVVLLVGLCCALWQVVIGMAWCVNRSVGFREISPIIVYLMSKWGFIF